MRVKCKKHPRKVIKFYCSGDKTLICSECLLLDHLGHTGLESAVPHLYKQEAEKTINENQAFNVEMVKKI